MYCISSRTFRASSWSNRHANVREYDRINVEAINIDECRRAYNYKFPAQRPHREIQLQHPHAEYTARSFDSTVDGGNRNFQPAREFEINHVIPLHVIALAQVYKLRRIEFHRQRLKIEPTQRRLRRAEL